MVPSLATSAGLRDIVTNTGFAMLAAGAVFGAVAAAIATGAGLMSASGKGYHISLNGAEFARYGGGAVLGAALLAGLGVVVGSLISAQIGAIVTVFVWGLAVEQILAGVSASAARFLPLIGAMTMAGADHRRLRRDIT